MIKKTTRTRAEAKKLMWEYYRENKERLSDAISTQREKIIETLRSGVSVSDAFEPYTRKIARILTKPAI